MVKQSFNKKRTKNQNLTETMLAMREKKKKKKREREKERREEGVFLVFGNFSPHRKTRSPNDSNHRRNLKGRNLSIWDREIGDFG